MDVGSKSKGYALTGLLCAGAVGCGPDVVAAEDETGATGFPMTDTGASETDESSSSSTSDDESTSATTFSTDDGGGACEYRGTVCGELEVCQCSCDYTADCCWCEPTTCTDDSHCPDGTFCSIWVSQHWAESDCLPLSCQTAVAIELIGVEADPSAFADVACASSVTIEGTALTDLSGLSDLEHVLDSVSITDNPDLQTLDGLAIPAVEWLALTYNDSLTNVDALASLESIGYGEVYCNGALDPEHLDAVLAAIPDAQVAAGQNGEGPCR